MIDLELYQQIIERKKTNALELQDAPFFQVKKDGCIAYLLGTDHAYDLSILPKFILEHIKESDQLFTESATPSKEGYFAFLQSLRVKSPEQVIWNKFLNKDQINSLREIVYAAFETFANGVEKLFDPLELEPSILIYFVKSFIELCVEQMQINGDNSPKMVAGLQMDLELQDLFCNHEIGLEPYGLGSLSVDEFDDNSIETLQKYIFPFYNDYKNLGNLSVIEKESLLILHTELLSKSKKEKGSYNAQLINDFAKAVDLDNEIKNDGLNTMAIRNLIMFNSLDASIASYSKPLYAVGADHLIGSLGLINILCLKGYTVSQIIPNDLPKPINYLYNVYARSYAAIKQEILERSKSYTVSQIIPNDPSKPINHLYNMYARSYTVIKQDILERSKKSKL